MKSQNIKFGIRNKFITIFVVSAILLLILNVYLGLSSLNKAKTASLDTGNTLLLEQTKDYYQKYTTSQKETLELLIHNIESDVLSLKNYTQKLYESKSIINTKEYWNYKNHLTHLPNNQLIQKETDKSTLWSPTWMNVNEKVLKKIETSAYLNEYFEPLLNRNINTVANYFLGTEGFLRYYPRVNMLELFSPDYRTIDDIYFLPATPKNNPSKKLKWTPLYKDPAGQGLMVSAVAPVYVKDEFIGVVGTDMTLDKLVEHYIDENSNESNYSILLDKNFRPIALPPKALKDIYKLDTVDNRLISKSLLSYNSKFRAVFNKIKDIDKGFEKVELEDRTLYISFVKLDNINWFYANILSEDKLLNVTKKLNEEIDLIIKDLMKNFTLPTILILITLIFIITYLINKIIEPIVKLSETTKIISETEKKKEINIVANDEIGVLIKNFKNMQNTIFEKKEELKKFNKELQQKVYERTEELEESNEELQASITNLKEAQNQLVESEKLASLGSLVAGVAHEVNTPVGIGLTGITHLVEESKKVQILYDEDKMTQEDFENYIKTVDELSKLINTNLQRTAHLVKSFKQMSVDQTSEEKRVFDLKKYIEEILFSLSNITKKLNLSINIKCDEEIRINSYPGSISQIITNLIINSIRHGFEDKKEGNINIFLTKNENTIQIIYEDNGKGIKKKNLDKIYDPFFTTNRQKGNTGLGLNIIYNIITKSLNGSINCKSEELKGVKFTITFKV